VTERDVFSVEVPGGSLGGWVTGSGPPALLLHGGPGLDFSYVDDLAAELADGFRVASFQQRGLEPSTEEGPFSIEQAIADVVSVLDGLGWERALVVGHSWGGQLALRVAAAHPHRLVGALAVDPIGLVGDGGVAAFEAELVARVPRAARERADELDEHLLAGEGTPEEIAESLGIVWPAYFADPQTAPAMPAMDFSLAAYSGIVADMPVEVERVAGQLVAGGVPYGIVAGGASPIPWGQAAALTVELSPSAFLDVVPSAGHFVWFEGPGRVLAALKRLAGEAASVSPD